MSVKEKFRIVKVGREFAREGQGHTRYPYIYEAYVEELTSKRVRISGFLWWAKYTVITAAYWKYIGYHLSEHSVREYVIKRVAGRHSEGEVIAEFEL